MTQYITLNVKLYNSQLNKLENGTKVTLNLSSNVIGTSNEETSFPHKLYLTNTQVSRSCKPFSNTQLSKIIKNSIIENGAIRRIFR